MLKQITVNIIVDDREPEKCHDGCRFFSLDYDTDFCVLYKVGLDNYYRCRQCLEEAR